jgi:hypothetical protein
MSHSDIESRLQEIELRLAGVGELPPEVELSIRQLLNLVEAICSDSKALAAEVERLRSQLERKKNAKTTARPDQEDESPGARDADHSSEKRRRQPRPPRSGHDRRTFKALTVHETIECPVDPAALPADAVRVGDESVIVQDIEIKPRNIRFQRHVYYSPAINKYIYGRLPAGYDAGGFGFGVRALILSLKYCGNMSEPKIRELLEHFDVQVSSGSISNILTNTANWFEREFDEIVDAGLRSTSYQQTDDTSARVAGEFWHTHILCNPFYAAYFTRPRKDRLTVLEILQNTRDLRFQLDWETLELLRREFEIPLKWQRAIEDHGDARFDQAGMKALLDDWFGESCGQVRTAIEQAAAIVYYRRQTTTPVVETIVCDDAGQFKLLTDKLALCWIHAGRHYAKLSPVAARHAALLERFLDDYWTYYALLQRYRDGPSREMADWLRLLFDELFSTRTGYDDLDHRIALTAAKKEELLTVLSRPAVPLHNNASELQARVSARRRDVSLHSRSIRGARAMDIFTTIVQTSKLLGVNAYAYLADRLSRRNAMPSLAQLIQTTAPGYAVT